MGPVARILALARFYRRAVPHGWYGRAPFLPVPSRRYLDWRFQTAYGASRPSWRVIGADLWQFGGWLADLDRPDSGG